MYLHAASSLMICSFPESALPYQQRDWFPFASKAALKWPSRSLLLEAEVKQIGTDIMCFQEVDAAYVPTFWKPFLTNIGACFSV